MHVTSGVLIFYPCIAHNEFGHQNKLRPQEIVPITSLLQGADDNEAIAKGSYLH